MRISQKAWQKYIKMLRAIDKKAAEMMLAYVERYGIENRQRLIEYAYHIAVKYGEASAACAADMYEAIAQLCGAYSDAEVAELAEYSEVAKTVNGTLKKGNAKVMAYAIGALVRRAGADTMVKSAIRQNSKSRNSKVEYAWISNGDSCPYCLMLAAEGWKPANKDALRDGHAVHVHSNCDCTYSVRFTPELSIEGYNEKKYKEIYETAEGKTPEEKLNFLRRQHREEHKEEINAQKREAYAERKLRENEGKPEA